MQIMEQTTPKALQTNRLKSRLVLLVLVLIFSSPIVLSFLWQPTGFVNNGELIEPALVLHNASLSTLEGEAFDTSGFNDKWMLMIADAASCDKACQKKLYHMRQVRVAQGKNMGRVGYAWLLTDDAQDFFEPDAALLEAHSSMLVLQNGVDSVAGFMSQMKLAEEHKNDILLIDPIGHLIMRFSAELDAGKMHKDLKRLLTVSPLGE